MHICTMRLPHILIFCNPLDFYFICWSRLSSANAWWNRNEFFFSAAYISKNARNAFCMSPCFPPVRHNRWSSTNVSLHLSTSSVSGMKPCIVPFWKLQPSSSSINFLASRRTPEESSSERVRISAMIHTFWWFWWDYRTRRSFLDVKVVVPRDSITFFRNLFPLESIVEDRIWISLWAWTGHTSQITKLLKSNSSMMCCKNSYP